MAAPEKNNNNTNTNKYNVANSPLFIIIRAAKNEFFGSSGFMGGGGEVVKRLS